MSQVALYLGWYDQQVSGPFTGSTVEFMPGAFAYHLYSFSAQTLRTPHQGWATTLLEKGATCTMGMVDEPYLQYTPDLYVFVAAFMAFGYTFGEAAYASQTVLSWQTTIIGDPLYRPRTRTEDELRTALAGRGSALVEWIALMNTNRKLAIGASAPGILDILEGDPATRQSAVLTEKVGDLYLAQTKMPDALAAYEAALKRGPSPVQRLRLLLSLAQGRSAFGPDDKALAWYEMVLKDYPDYPETLRLHQQILPLAKRLNRTSEMERSEKEIKRLSELEKNGKKP
jgi:tetratricopeptide (TPR) repeat protein